MKKLINKILNLLGYKIKKIDPHNVFDFENFLLRFILKKNEVNLIQIGAYDGNLYDPIQNFILNNKKKIKAYLFEPQKEPYNILLEKYSKFKNVTPVNLAIHPTEEKTKLFRINPSKVNDQNSHLNGIGSLNLDHTKKFALESSQFIEEIDVQCISLNKFLYEKSIKSLDILVMDCEGFDYEIIKAINFEKIKPKIIRFEHGVRDNVMQKEKFLEICSILNKNGYQIITEIYDATAYLISIDELIF